MSKKIIELKNIVKTYDGVNVVDNINFYVNENEFITFLGPSGCGKTTTLRLIGGFEDPTSGEIILDGVNISNLEPYERPINTVFQKYALFPHLNVFENVAFGLKNFNRVFQELKRNVRLRYEPRRIELQSLISSKETSDSDKKKYKAELKGLRSEIQVTIQNEKDKLIEKRKQEALDKYNPLIASLEEKIDIEWEKDDEVKTAKLRLKEINALVEEQISKGVSKTKAQQPYAAEMKQLQRISVWEELGILEKKLKTAKKDLAAELKSAKSLMMTKKQIKNAVIETLKLVKLEGLIDRKISTLSGGQQQRIAIARAIINKPRILLLDEPLAALDLKLRQEMQYELKEIQRNLGITFIFVTHDQEEALTMSDTIVVMDKGNIQQIGTPEDIYNEPKNSFVANFIGESNIIDGVYLGNGQAKFMNHVFNYNDDSFKQFEKVDVVIRPEDFDIVPLNKAKLIGVVESIVFKGVHFEICCDVQGKEIVIHNYEIVKVGDKIGLSIDPYEIHLMKKHEKI